MGERYITADRKTALSETIDSKLTDIKVSDIIEESWKKTERNNLLNLT